MVASEPTAILYNTCIAVAVKAPAVPEEADVRAVQSVAVTLCRAVSQNMMSKSPAVFPAGRPGAQVVVELDTVPIARRVGSAEATEARRRSARRSFVTRTIS